MPQGCIIHGLHSVRAALRYDPAHVLEAWLDQRCHGNRWQTLRQQLVAHACPVHVVHRRELDALTGGQAHQGVAVRYTGQPPRDEQELAAFLGTLEEAPLLLVLDQVQDPHNLGACLRTASAAGVHALIAPRDRAVSLTPAVHKVACGAVQSLPFFQVTNLARTLRMLRDAGLWLIGTAEQAERSHFEADLCGPLALVMGAEESGLRRLTREHCDGLVRIPMLGTVSSLNVSVAAGVVLYEAMRQRTRNFTDQPIQE